MAKGKGLELIVDTKWCAGFFLAVYTQLSLAETVASASYKDVCNKMRQEGVSSRTQAMPNTTSPTDNVVVFVEAGSRAGPRNKGSVSNAEILVGTNMTQISTTNAQPQRDERGSAPSANPCR